VKGRNWRIAALVAAPVALLIACTTLSEIGTQIGLETGTITEEQAASINRTSAALEKSWADITPEQEYYIGRAVAATILQTYPALDDPLANDYLNRVGQTLAMASDRPETFGGYHFLLLDSDEINAFAAPGGLILVCRGLLRCCESEDALASVLAHEIGHVQNRDGLRAIEQSRLTSALTILSVETARNLGSEELKELVGEFEGSISDVTQTLITRGYARGQEYDADRAARMILERVGYNSRALPAMLAQMEEGWDPQGLGFARTHPSPRNRREELEKVSFQTMPPLEEPPSRRARFLAALDAR
jgi:beta-barrel assembly-enhancing protease